MKRIYRDVLRMAQEAGFDAEMIYVSNGHNKLILKRNGKRFKIPVSNTPRDEKHMLDAVRRDLRNYCQG